MLNFIVFAIRLSTKSAQKWVLFQLDCYKMIYRCAAVISYVWIIYGPILFLKKMGQPRPLLSLSSTFLNSKPGTTVYSDWLSIHYPPISDAFHFIVFFLHYTNDSTLTLFRNSLFNVNKQFFSLLKKHLKWEGMK